MTDQPSIAQAVLGIKEPYVDYDFDQRKKRRASLNQLHLNLEVASENLILIKTVLDKHKVTFWLVYGTLLGAIREGAFIRHDTDTDLGVYISDRSRLIEALRELLENGFELIRTKCPDDLVTIMKDDEYVDIGIYRLDKDKCGKYFYVYQNNREYIPSFEELSTFSFIKHNFKIPYNSAMLLERWYGKTWKFPQKNFPAWTYKTGVLSKIKSILFGGLS